MPYQYQYTPFPSRQAFIYQNCHTWGAKDIGAVGITWGEPVYAVEDGTVVFIYTISTCFSGTNIPQVQRTIPCGGTASFPNSNTITAATSCAIGNGIAVRGNDGFFTEYFHVKACPNLTLCSTVRAGDLIGYVDNSSSTTAPHVHLARYTPNPDYQCSNTDNRFRGINFQGEAATCNWTMFNVMGIIPTPSNGWVLDQDNKENGPNGTWYYYVNGMRQTNRFVSTNNVTWYWVNNIGAYTGSYYYYDNTRQYYRLWWTPTLRWYRWNGFRWVLE